MAKLIKKIARKLRFGYDYYWRYKADPASYLRAQGAQIGRNPSLLGGIASFNSAEPYLIRIGDNVTITQGVLLVTHDGGTRVFRDINPAWTKGTVKIGTIDIGDNVFIGVGAIILQDTKIGSNSVVGAGAVVTGDIPANTVAVGIPARVVCSVETYMQRSLQAAITIPDEYLDRRKEYLMRHFWHQPHD